MRIVVPQNPAIVRSTQPEMNKRQVVLHYIAIGIFKDLFANHTMHAGFAPDLMCFIDDLSRADLANTFPGHTMDYTPRCREL